MDNERPKRRKDKYNPYTISKREGHYYLRFRDGQGIPHNYEVDKPLYDLFDSFELEDKAFLNEQDRHLEQSELTDASLNSRAFETPPALDDLVIDAILAEQLHKAIAGLPEKQQRRLRLYYFGKLTYEQIAKLEGCTKRAVKFSVDLAIQVLQENFL